MPILRGMRHVRLPFILLSVAPLTVTPLAWAGEGPALAAAERAVLVAALERSRDAVLSEVARLSEVQAAFQPAPERWGAVHIVEHLALVEDAVMASLPAILKAPAVAPRGDGGETLRAIGERSRDRETRYDAPEPVRPSGRFGSLAATLQAFTSRRARTIAYVSTTADPLRSRRAPHPVLGLELDAYEHLSVLPAHTERHLAQIREVLAAPGFPASPSDRMAPLAGYLMPDRAEEIALARSAAPAQVADGARVLVLGPSGHETAVEGSNGFTCVVMRGWGSPSFVGGKRYPDFWNVRVRAPICFNPAGVETALPVYLAKTELALAGKTFDELLAEVSRRYGDGVLQVPAPGTMAYMMSPRQYLGDAAGHFKPHLMLYVPYAKAGEWSGDRPVGDAFVGADEGSPQAIVIVPLPRWSDGTPAGAH